MACDLGIVSDRRKAQFDRKMKKLALAKSMIGEFSLTPPEAGRHGMKMAENGVRRNGLDLLAIPGITVERLSQVWPALGDIETETARQVERDAIYGKYLEQQKRSADALRRDEARRIPAEIDYGSISGLSAELSGKLHSAKPETLGQARRIDGMTPAALALILAKIRVSERRQAK